MKRTIPLIIYILSLAAACAAQQAEDAKEKLVHFLTGGSEKTWVIEVAQTYQGYDTCSYAARYIFNISRVLTIRQCSNNFIEERIQTWELKPLSSGEWQLVIGDGVTYYIDFFRKDDREMISLRSYDLKSQRPVRDINLYH